MKKALSILTLVLALSMLCSIALADTPTAIAHKAAAPIVVDGDLSEWDLSSPLVIKDATQVIRDLSFWQGENDLSGNVYVAYDETNLYLAFDVTEDTPFGAIEMLPLDGEDNIKIYISTNPADDPNRTEYHTNDFLLYLIIDSGREYYDTAFDRSMVAKDYRERFISKGMDGGEDVLEGYERMAVPSTTGYVFEVVIPWANFSNNKIAAYAPQSGDVIKFNIALTDISYPCPGTEFIPQMAWSGTSMINTNPSEWGNLQFE